MFFNFQNTQFVILTFRKRYHWFFAYIVPKMYFIILNKCYNNSENNDAQLKGVSNERTFTNY